MQGWRSDAAAAGKALPDLVISGRRVVFKKWRQPESKSTSCRQLFNLVVGR